MNDKPTELEQQFMRVIEDRMTLVPNFSWIDIVDLMSWAYRKGQEDS